MKVKLTPKETATVLAALRALQEDWENIPSLTRARFQFEEHEPLTPDEIDDLCVRINCGEHSENMKVASELADIVVADKYGDARWETHANGDEHYTEEAQDYFTEYYHRFLEYLEPDRSGETPKPHPLQDTQFDPPDLHRREVQVIGCSAEQADQVLRERLGHDEDYGFAYTLNW